MILQKIQKGVIFESNFISSYFEGVIFQGQYSTIELQSLTSSSKRQKLQIAELKT